MATAVTRATVAEPINGIINIAGPEKLGMDDFVRNRFAATGDPRQVVTDPTAPYFREVIDEHTIVPLEGEGATIYSTRFSDWMASRATSGAH